MKRRSIRNRHGAALGLAAALTFALLLLALGFFMISLYFGASRETRNATDAGALNVGKKSLTVTVKSLGGDEDQYKEVADANGEFGLTNINRVWGKALWVAINAQDIKDESKENGDTSAHAAAMFQAAENISDRLADKLNDPANLYPLFNEVSQANNVRMLGGTATTKALPGPNWKTSLLERTEESNVFIDKKQLPSEVDLSELNTTNKKTGDKNCLRGYKGVNMYGRDYWFVPFKYNERPRLESQTHFEQNSLVSQALSGWAKPVPNTFSIESRTTAGSPADQRATACVKANPMQTFQLRFPHAYIRLVFPENKVKYHLNGLPMFYNDSEYGYGPAPESKTKVFYVPACGSGQATVSLANEYTNPTIGGRLFPTSKFIDQPSWAGVKSALLQRCREIDPSVDDINGILNTPTLGSDDTYYIVPNPAGGGVVCVSSSMVVGIAPWISGKQNATPDSSAQDFDEYWPIYTYNNSVTSWVLECGSLTQPAGTGVLSWVTAEGETEWKRGTGYDGFLGEMKVNRQTNVHLTGACSCVF